MAAKDFFSLCRFQSGHSWACQPIIQVRWEAAERECTRAVMSPGGLMRPSECVFASRSRILAVCSMFSMQAHLQAFFGQIRAGLVLVKFCAVSHLLV